MAGGAVRGAPYGAARTLWAWATVNAPWVRAQALVKLGCLHLPDLPATALWDLIYCLVLEDTKEARDHREKIDALLDSQSVGRPDRATWGKLPAHQRAMKNAPL